VADQAFSLACPWASVAEEKFAWHNYRLLEDNPSRWRNDDVVEFRSYL